MRRDKIDNSRMFSDAVYGFAVGDAVGFPHKGNSVKEMRAAPCDDMMDFCMYSSLTQQCLSNLQMLCENDKIYIPNKANEDYVYNYIIPVCLYGIWMYNDRKPIQDIIQYITKYVRETNGTDEDVVICIIYYFIARHILYDYFDLKTRVKNGIDDAVLHCSKLNQNSSDTELLFEEFERIVIHKQGYIRKTHNDNYRVLLESILCLIKTKNYRDCVLKAVNMGGDAANDRAAIAGSLAGLEYGEYEIPDEWKYNLVGWIYVDNICELANKKYEVKL